jgi:hypothetical protein
MLSQQRIYILGTYSEEEKETYNNNPDAIVNIDAAVSDLDASWNIAQHCQGDSTCQKGISSWYFDGVTLIERTEKIMELDQQPDENANNNSGHKEFICQEEIATNEEIAKAP